MNYHNNKKVIRRRTYIYSLAFILAIFLVSLVYGYLLGWVLSWVVHIQHLNLILSFLFFVYLTTHAITKYNSLATVGGKAIAEKLDAVLIEGSNLDINSIKVKNIVEELSIASGIKPPSIYVLKRELGMNAFVAGFTEDDAVFIISQGAIEKFNRDELSAVISHEYCHLQNGDMAFNMLMLCWAKGLDLPYRKASKIFRNRIDFIIRNKSKSGWLILFTGLIMFLGILGHALCGAIIAAINRNREYLADADAIRLNRENTGLVSALKKIYLSPERSYLMYCNNELNIFMFADSSVSYLYASHPPIASRIKAINPQFNINELENNNDTPYNKDLDTRYQGIGRVFIYAFYMIAKNIGEVSMSTGSIGKKMIENSNAYIPGHLLVMAQDKSQCTRLITNLLFQPNTYSIAKHNACCILFFNALLKLSDQPKHEIRKFIDEISNLSTADQDIHQICWTFILKMIFQDTIIKQNKTFLLLLPSISKLLMLVCSKCAPKEPEKEYTLVMRHLLIDINLPYQEIKNPREVITEILPEIVQLDYDSRVKLLLCINNIFSIHRSKVEPEGEALVLSLNYILSISNKRDTSIMTGEDDLNIHTHDPLK